MRKPLVVVLVVAGSILAACTGDDPGPLTVYPDSDAGAAPDDGGTSSSSSSSSGTSGTPGDASTPVPMRCDAPGRAIDAHCTCKPGVQEACDVHAGKDGTGTCKAGTHTCELGAEPTTSAFGACNGSVAPAADDCAADGADKDCDGIKGNGTGCTRKVYLYGSSAYSCAAGSTTWPTDLYLVDADDPTSVPNGLIMLAPMHMFTAGGGTKTAVYRCLNTTNNYHYVGFSGCAASDTSQRLVGYVSTVDGGKGWTKVGNIFGRGFGPTAILPFSSTLCGTCCATGTTTYYMLE